jgi:Tripartite tricarboxylate transporter TctB family
MNRNLLTGIVFIAIALLFNFISMSYTNGTLDNPGPGLFPFAVSAALLIIGVIVVIRTWFVEVELIDFKFKNISVISLSLVGFALATEYINMVAGIIVLIAISSSSADPDQTFMRSVKLIIGLTAVAYAFKYLLGLNLPLL